MRHITKTAQPSERRPARRRSAAAGVARLSCPCAVDADDASRAQVGSMEWAAAGEGCPARAARQRCVASVVKLSMLGAK